MAKDFRFSRSTSIAAPPERVHALIDDFHEWPKWSPWDGLDPHMSRQYSGPATGVGAVYAWQGNGKAGQGRMEILESSADHVVVDLDFAAPMRARNRIDFTLTPTGPGTEVEWVMTGPQNFVMGLMSKLWSMDKMLGPDFDRGLAALKRAAEQA
ncbi:MAG: SRPBCC family protein [Dermatophilaceae bacterium]